VQMVTEFKGEGRGTRENGPRRLPRPAASISGKQAAIFVVETRRDYRWRTGKIRRDRTLTEIAVFGVSPLITARAGLARKIISHGKFAAGIKGGNEALRTRLVMQEAPLCRQKVLVPPGALHGTIIHILYV